MAYRIDDPYTQGIGTPNLGNMNLGLGNMNLGQVPVNNMQVAGGYDTPTAGDYGFNLIQLDRLKRGGYNPGEVSNWENKEDVQSLIRSLEPQASLDDDFYNEYGYPKTASLINPKKMWDMLRMYNAAKKVKPVFGGIIAAQKEKAAQAAASQAAANAAAAGQRREGRGGTHMSRSRDRGGLGISQSQAQAVSDANRAAGMSGWGLARGGRDSYFDGGLASLWPR